MGHQRHGQDGGQTLQDGRQGKDFEGKVDVFLIRPHIHCAEGGYKEDEEKPGDGAKQ